MGFNSGFKGLNTHLLERTVFPVVFLYLLMVLAWVARTVLGDIVHMCIAHK